MHESAQQAEPVSDRSVSVPSTRGVEGGTRRSQGIRAALERSLPYLLFAALPAVVAVTMFAIALRSGPLALDFHHELYPEAKEIIAGNNPFPAEGTDLTRGENYVWPPLAALLVSPLTILPPTVADVAIGLLGLACIGARAVARRRPRLARLRRRGALAAGDRRDPHLAPHSGSLPAGGDRLAVPGLDRSTRASARTGRRGEVLSLAARTLAARAPERQGRASRRCRGGRVTVARAPVHGARRVRTLDGRPRSSVRPGLVFAVRLCSSGSAPRTRWPGA